MPKLAITSLPIDCDLTELRDALNEMLAETNEPLCPNCGDVGCPYCEGHVEISREDLPALLAGMGKHSFACLVSDSVVADGQLIKPKTQGISGRIRKLTKVQLYTGHAVSYANIVRNRQEKLAGEIGQDTPDWEPAPRQWGERIQGTPFVFHKGELYLETMVTRCLEVAYKLDGVFVDKADLEGYIRERDTDNVGRQLLTEEKAVIWRDYKLCNIVQVTLDKRVYTVV